jgi:hypothetical protein
MTHAKTAPCPLVGEDFQWEVARGTCCSLDVRTVLNLLKKFGEQELAEQVRTVGSAEEAEALGQLLMVRGEKILNTDCGGSRKFANDCYEVMHLGQWLEKVGGCGFTVAFAGSHAEMHRGDVSYRRAA